MALAYGLMALGAGGSFKDLWGSPVLTGPGKGGEVVRLVLARALSYVHRSVADPSKVIHFRRGIAVGNLSPQDYEFLSTKGGFVDPDREIDWTTPRALRAAPPGTVVPIVRTMGLGDVLMLTIALRELAQVYPRLRFIYATGQPYLAALRDLDFLDAVVPVESLLGHYPYGIEMRGFSERNGNERKFRIDCYAEHLLGRKPLDYSYPLKRRDEERARGRALAEEPEVGGRPVLGIVARASQGNRSWPFRSQGELALKASREGWKPVLIDVARLEPDGNFLASGGVNLTGKLDMHALMALVQGCDVVVSPDTGVLHLAEALSTRTVAIMSTVDPDARLRHYRWTRSLWASLPCSPCYHSACNLPDPKPCTRAISVEAVWREVLFMAERNPPWPLDAEFTPIPVDFPRRAPLKDVRLRQRVDLAQVAMA
jgi:ADP-heptose:LPS heptosyltransferase